MAFTKYPTFFLFHSFLIPLGDAVSAESSPESLQLGCFMFVEGSKPSENLYLIHNTEFANYAH